jgi:phosphopantetheinyl transferase (holo-ACP synthase)
MCIWISYKALYPDIIATWKNIYVEKDEHHMKPYLKYDVSLLKQYPQLEHYQSHMSLSHDSDYLVACVFLIPKKT